MTQPRIGQLIRYCEHCGQKFSAWRKDHRYCSDGCRKKACKARLKQEIPTAYCRWCGKPFQTTNSRAMYDSAACKQAMYRARKGAGKQLMF